MSENPSSKLPQSVPNSEDGDFSRKHHALILDENITKIINKYKRYAPYTQANGINKVIENNNTIEEAQPLKINTDTLSERQNNYLCENTCSIKSNKNKFPPVVNKNTITRADKTTYCRPVTKYIPEVYRTATKKNGLRNILQILSTLRQKEVEEALMSTYIDFLKKKHLPEECKSLTCIQDIIGSKARMILVKRDQMVDHFNEKYIAHSIINKPHQYRFHGTFNSTKDLAHKIIRSPCKKVFHVTQNRQETKLFDDDMYQNCSTHLTEGKKYVMNTRPGNSQTKQAVKNCDTQAYTNVFKPKKLCHDKSASTKFVEKKDHQKQEEITENSVLTIGNKIYTLIQAMNDFMNEINLLKITNLEEKRRKKCNNKSQTPTEELMDYNIKNHGNIVSYNYLPSREQKSKLGETVLNTHKVTVDKINKKSSIQIKCKVSTRDHYTEISRSLSRQNINCKIIADTSHTEKTTIALNTDPISLRALLKISSEAIRGFFSLDLLSYLQLPRLEWSDPRPCLCDTNINVDKISNRFFNTGCSKKLTPVGPYKCQYCDEVFDKACSWERHEFYCARTLKALERKCGMFRVC